MSSTEQMRADPLARTGIITNHPSLNRLAIYQQGGLDNYCGFYAIFNLINFIKFKLSNWTNLDFIGGVQGGDRPFSGFDAAMTEEMLSLHSKLRGFGGDGTRPSWLHKPLESALAGAGILASVSRRRFVGDESTELALAAVHERDGETLGHWVVLVGSANFDGLRLAKSDEATESAVLDSQRNYRSWRLKNGEISVKRHNEIESTKVTIEQYILSVTL